MEASGSLHLSYTPNAHKDGGCPDHPGWMFRCVETGEVAPYRCGRNRCVVCGAAKAYRVGLAIGLAEPPRFFTLTQVGNHPQEVRERMRVLLQHLRRAGYPWEVAWSAEPNPKGTGAHVHGYQHGPFTPQPLLSRFAESAGMGRVVDIRQARVKGMHGYGLKALKSAGYSLKNASRKEAIEAYYEINGGRMVRVTRRFWRDGRDGEQLPTMRDAMRVAVQRRFGEGGEKTWELVRVG
jgi:hypothetical protein